MDDKLLEALTKAGVPLLVAEALVRWAQEKWVTNWTRSRALRSLAAKLAKANPAQQAELCQRFADKHVAEDSPAHATLKQAIGQWGTGSVV